MLLGIAILNLENINSHLFLDLKKAFDKTEHDIKMHYSQESCLVYYLPKSCQQHCYLKGQNSKKQSVNCGIPQGH